MYIKINRKRERGKIKKREERKIFLKNLKQNEGESKKNKKDVEQERGVKLKTSDVTDDKREGKRKMWGEVDKSGGRIQSSETDR